MSPFRSAKEIKIFRGAKGDNEAHGLRRKASRRAGSVMHLWGQADDSETPKGASEGNRNPALRLGLVCPARRRERGVTQSGSRVNHAENAPRALCGAIDEDAGTAERLIPSADPPARRKNARKADERVGPGVNRHHQPSIDDLLVV